MGRDYAGLEFTRMLASVGLLHALIRNQKRQRERVGVKIGITRNAANAACGADLPIGPTIFGAGIHIITATAAAVPGIAGVQIFPIVMGDPGREVTGRGKIAHSIAGAGI